MLAILVMHGTMGIIYRLRVPEHGVGMGRDSVGEPYKCRAFGCCAQAALAVMHYYDADMARTSSE